MRSTGPLVVVRRAGLALGPPLGRMMAAATDDAKISSRPSSVVSLPSNERALEFGVA